MTMYSTIKHDRTHEITDFQDRLDSFFSGEPLPPKDTGDCDLGATTEEAQHREQEELEAALSALDDLNADTPAPSITGRFVAAYDPDAELPEKIYSKPDPACRYGKAFARVRALEAQLECASPDDRPQVEADVTSANEEWDIEKRHALNDRYRGFYRIDSWRAGEGRDEYNASRRTTRDQPNASLAEMSDAERAAHKRALSADREWKRSKKAAGWTADQIEAGLEERRAKAKAANEAC